MNRLKSSATISLALGIAVFAVAVGMILDVDVLQIPIVRIMAGFGLIFAGFSILTIAHRENR